MKKKKTTKKKPGKPRKGAIADKQSVVGFEQMPDLEVRLERLERLFGSSLHAGMIRLPLPKAVTATETTIVDVDISLKKSDSSPDFVRVTHRGEVVLSPGASDGVIRNAAVGFYLDLWIEVAGNPGDIAQIDVTHAMPDLAVQIPLYVGQWGEPRSLFVTG